MRKIGPSQKSHQSGIFRTRNPSFDELRETLRRKNFCGSLGRQRASKSKLGQVGFEQASKKNDIEGLWDRWGPEGFFYWSGTDGIQIALGQIGFFSPPCWMVTEGHKIQVGPDSVLKGVVAGRYQMQ